MTLKAVGRVEVTEVREKRVRFCDNCEQAQPEYRTSDEDTWLYLRWPAMDAYVWGDLVPPPDNADLCSTACAAAFITRGEGFLRDNGCL